MKPSPSAEPGFIGDLAAIRTRGELRVLSLDGSQQSLPRSGSPLIHERALVSEFGKELGVEIRWVAVDGLDELIPALIAGKGDLIADNFTSTTERSQRIVFSAPITSVTEQVVVRASEVDIRNPRDLVGHTLVAQAGSSLEDSLADLQTRVAGIRILRANKDVGFDDILQGVADGGFDMALADSNLVADALTWIDGLRVAFAIGEPRIIAWGLRKNNTELRRAADQFIAQSSLGGHGRALHTGDLEAIRQRGVLRVLTRNSGSTYFLWKGQLFGFEYDMAKRFAESEGVRIEMVVAPTREDLLPWLLAGRADIVAAGLSAGDERATREGVVFSRRYHEVRETIVARVDEPAPKSIETLDGRTLVVRESSSYWITLRALLAEGAGFELHAAPEQQETEEIIGRVASGEYDLTLADSHIVAIELAHRDDIQAGVTLGDPVQHGWAIRPSNPGLIAAINAFWKKEYRGLVYNMTANKYFKNDRKMKSHAVHRSGTRGEISSYDDPTRRHAAKHGFDARLSLAQMYQESRFNPNARSFAGALGLLQVMPRTAKELGIGADQLAEPEVGIETGVRYLSWVRSRFSEQLPSAERTWFSLAAYNVGPGHVRDARKLAKQRGLDPDQWFDNVEVAMLSKEDPQVHRSTRYGYCRGSEPVRYVREIRDRYRAYLEVAGAGSAPIE